MAKSRKRKQGAQQAASGAAVSKQEARQAEDAAYDAEEKAQANASAQAASLPKKAKRKHTGKEVAVIVVSVIMVVSILLPSFAQIFASSGTSSQDLPQSYEAAADLYGPKVDDAKAALEKNPDDLTAAMDLGNAYYQWGVYASSYADSETQKTESQELMDDAIQAYTGYLDKAGSLSSDDAKTAAMNRAFCYYYGDDQDKGIELMSQLADETNYAPAWANLGMMYESNGETSQAQSAFQKGIDADPDDQDGVKSYCQSRLESLKSDAQASSGGAAGLASQLDGTAKSAGTPDDGLSSVNVAG